jgi:hypothetical protein
MLGKGAREHGVWPVGDEGVVDAMGEQAVLVMILCQLLVQGDHVILVGK